MNNMNLEEARKRIDGIDRQMAQLFEERMKAVAEVAAYKKAENMPVFSGVREQEVLTKISEMTSEEFRGYLRVLYNTVFDVSKAYQVKKIGVPSKTAAEIKKALEESPEALPASALVACQGRAGAYSQKAAQRFFSAPSVMFFENFRGVFNAVKSGMCRYGILPLENSVYGTVNEVYDLMADFDFSIVRSCKIQVNHVLAANCDLSEVTKIISHTQAIGQCGKFLETLDIKAYPCDNTAAAAQTAAEQQGVAAICSRECAEMYGLKILKEDIADSDNNYTRFICISKEKEVYPGADKISFMLTLPHTHGSLYRMLSILAAAGINMTKIESRPISGKNFEFSFYFEVEASVYSEELQPVLSEIENVSRSFKFFGCYNEI